MSIKHYFSGEDMLPRGMEKSLTYSEVDDAYLFKKQWVRTKDIYHEIIAQIKKTVDPDCRYQEMPSGINPAVQVSVHMLFYLVTYFYCRFCFLSPYNRPVLAMLHTYEGKADLTMSVAKDVYLGCPNRELLIKKASYLSIVSGFPLTVEEGSQTVTFRFSLIPEKKHPLFTFSALAFAHVDRIVEAAVSAAKTDGKNSAPRIF